jgi:hypothetical protein
VTIVWVLKQGLPDHAARVRCCLVALFVLHLLLIRLWNVVLSCSSAFQKVKVVFAQNSWAWLHYHRLFFLVCLLVQRSFCKLVIMKGVWTSVNALGLRLVSFF